VPAKQSIVEFVTQVTTPGSPNFVPVSERIAVFDNDGTLWCEQPIPVQMYFALDRVKTLALRHPEWKTKEPFASVFKGNLKAAFAGGDRTLLQLLMATHAGMTTGDIYHESCQASQYIAGVSLRIRSLCRVSYCWRQRQG
jgi:hypothetical protein